MAFNRGNRTYHLNDECLRAFHALPTEDKLRWRNSPLSADDTSRRENERWPGQGAE